MSRRGIPALLVVVALLVGIVLLGRDTEASPDPVFSSPAGTWMPAVADVGALTGSWFCPGVPASGADGVGGSVVISNRDGEQIVGRFTVVGPDGVAAERDFTVEPWSRSTIDVDAFVQSPFASVVVEIDGGRGFVEQIANHPAGDSVAPCASDTSNEWYFADGFTAGGSVETLILTNPYDDVVLADLRFATESGNSQPSTFRGFPIQPRSVKVIEIAEFGNRDEQVIAAAVTTRSGRLVVGRAQHYTGAGRLGYDVSLAAPALRDQWWFADGERGENITETFSIYNPTEENVDVDAFFLGVPADVNSGPFTVSVPARQVVIYRPFEGSAQDEPDRDFFVSDLPNGRHAVVFSTLAQPSVVVERVLTRPAGDSIATSVVMGAPPRPDGFVATRWHIGAGPQTATEDALVVYNVDSEQATITIEAIGPGGPSAIPSLTDIPLGPGAVITIDLDANDALNQELVVNASNRVFIERSLSRGNGLAGRSGSWALPFSPT